MTQQVVHARTSFTSTSPMVDNASFDIAIEQLGTSTNLTYSTVFSKITRFFTSVISPNTQAIGAYMSAVMSRAVNACTIELFDITAHLNGSPAGAPVAIQQFTLPTTVGGGGFPEGCAMLVGYRSAYGTDVEFVPGSRPRSRDRNRFYLGPLAGAMTSSESGTNRTIWTPAYLGYFKVALSDLQSSAGTSDVPTWVQWSRKNASVKPITNMWIEDAPRYQRRRVDSGADYIVF